MKKLAYYLLVVLALVVITQSTAFSVYDAPHNETNNIFCGDCHGQALDIRDSEDNPIVSPFWDGTSSADAVYNALCLRCHNGSDAPLANSHAPGSTLIKCTICHHNHGQDQVYPGKYNKNNFFIARGTALSAVESGGVTTISYTVPTGLWATNPGSDWAADLANLASKTEAGRGAMLVPTIAWSQSRWPVFEIESINTATGEITVKGDVSATAELKAQAADFGIFYGQQIRSIITYEGNLKYVQFFDNKGSYSFVNQTAPTGICQICHSDTNHFQSTLGAAPGGDNHNPDSNCALCHKHNDTNNGAFFPSADHVDDGLVIYPAPLTDNCDLCHDGDEISGLDTHGSDCQLCHVPSDNNRLRTIAEIEADGARVGRVTTPPSSPAGFLNGGTLGGTDGGGTCSECHSTYLSNWYFHEVDHTLMGWVTPNTDTSSNTVNCTGCHDASSILTGVHNLGASGTAKDTCDNCHDSASDTKNLIGSALNGNSNGPLPPHEDHTVDPVNECTSCHTTHFDAHDHGDDLGGADTIFHDITFTPAVDHNVDNTPCNACHTGNNADGNGTALDSWADIYSEHNSSCVLCHDYTDADSDGTPPLADVLANIPGSGVTCVSCHTPKDGPAFHGGHDATHFGFDAACVGCHNAILHGGGTEVVANVHANDCTICHSGSPQTRNNEKEGDAANGIDGDARLADGAASNATPFDPTVYTCTTCHPGAVPDDLTFATIHHDSKNDLAVDGNCSNCHILSYAGNHTATVALATNCAFCHTGTEGYASGNGIPTSAADDKKHDLCTTCHSIDATPTGLWYAVLSGSAAGKNGGSVGGTDGGGDCETCHGAYFPSHTIDHTTTVALDTNTAAKNDCIDCHTGTQGNVSGVPLDATTPAGDKKHDACSTCHDATGALTGSAAGQDNGTDAGTDGGGNCNTCHGVYFDSHTHGADGNHDLTYSRTADLAQEAPGTYCGVCHYDESGTSASLDTWLGILYEHDLDGTKNGTGACATCHDYGAVTTDTPPVASNDSTIASGTSNTCVSCHTPKIQPLTHGGHDSTHFTYDAVCLACHWNIGGNGAVVNAHANDCTICHSGAPNRNSEKEGNPLNGIDGDARLANGTAALFDGGDASAWTDVTCLTCHPNAVAGTLPFAGIHHDSKNGQAVAGTCVPCHVGSTNGNHTGTVALATNCADCHDETKGIVNGVPIDAANNKKHDACTTCHAIDATTTGMWYAVLIDPATSPLVTAMPDNGTTGGTDGGGDCEACHTIGFTGFHQTVDHDDVVDLHGNCGKCHSGTQAPTPGPVPLDAGDDKKHDACSVCHQANGRLSGSAVGFNNATNGGTDGGGDCQTCHNAFDQNHLTTVDHDPMVDEYVNCVGCHADTDAETGTNNGAVPLDGGDNKKHDTCSACHEADGDLTGSAAGKDFATVGGTDGGGTCFTCHTEYFSSHTNIDHSTSVALDTDTAAKNECVDCHTGTQGSTTTVPTDSGVTKAANKKHDDCFACHQVDGVLTGSAAPNDGGTANGTDGGGNCQTCHGDYFDSHTHGIASNHVVSYSAIPAGDLSQDGTTPDDYCAACHNDYTSTTASLNTWLGILYEHDLDGTKNGSGACSTCHDYGAVTTDTPPVGINDSLIANNTTSTCTTCHTPKDFNANPGTSLHGYLPHDDTPTRTVVTWTGASGSGTDPDCLVCHDDGSAEVVYSSTTHGGDCTKCHAGIPNPLQSTTSLATAMPDGGGPDTDNGGGDCIVCHTLSYSVHEVNNPSQATALHDKVDTTYAATNNCDDCHGGAGSLDTWVEIVALHSNDCSMCHSSDLTVVKTAITTGRIDSGGYLGSNTLVNCDTCHVTDSDFAGGDANWDLATLDTVAIKDTYGRGHGNSADTVRGEHNKLLESKGAVWQTTAGGTDAAKTDQPGTYNANIILNDSDYNCNDCHTIGAPAAATTPANQENRILEHDFGNCLLCHSYSSVSDEIAAGAGSVAFDEGASGTDTFCETCHASSNEPATPADNTDDMYQFDGLRHHTTGHAQAGDCTWCHGDPRTSPVTGSGWAGASVSNEGFEDEYTITPPASPAKQLPCRECHTNRANQYQDTGYSTAPTINTGGNDLIVYANTYSAANLTSAPGNTSVDVTDNGVQTVSQVEQHRIVSASGTLNAYNYGACLACHTVQIFHAKPIEGTDWTHGNNNPVEDEPYDVLRFAPGRGKFNLFELPYDCNYGGTTGVKGRGFQHGQMNDVCLGGDIEGQVHDNSDPTKARAKDIFKDVEGGDGSNNYETVAPGDGTGDNIPQKLNNAGTGYVPTATDGARPYPFGQFQSIPDHASVNNAEGILNANTLIPYFNDITAPAIPDDVQFVSASWNGTTVTVEARNDDGCAALSARTQPDSVVRITAGNFTGTTLCTGTFALGSISGVTLDIETTNAAGTNSTGNAIVDNSYGTIQISTADATVAESVGGVTITFTRTSGSTGAVSATVVNTGTATIGAGNDYTLSATTVNWADGDSTNKTITLTVNDDVVVGEPNETVILTIDSTTGGAKIGANDAVTTTITDNDIPGTIQISTADATVAESVGGVTITFTRTSGSTGAVSATVVNTGTATIGAGNDYTLSATTVNWADGDSTNKTITLTVNDDVVVGEPNETVILTIDSTTGSATIGANDAVTTTITDNDIPGTIQISTADASVDENVGTVIITLTRTVGTFGAVSATVVNTGTATIGAGNDYTLSTATVNWADGDSADKTITITVNDDTDAEPAETIILTIDSTTGSATIGANDAVTTTINASDPIGVLGISTADSSVAEDVGNVLITCTRTGGTNGAVSATVSTSGTATIGGGNDYTLSTTTCSWADGDSADKTVTITVNDDGVSESDETVILTLTGPTGGATLGADVTVTTTITDNDAPLVVTRTLGWIAWDNAAPATINVAAGSNRLLVVSVNGEDIAGNDCAVSNVRYENILLTQIGTTAFQGSAAYSNCTWVGYCDEACLTNGGADSSNNITVTTTNLDSGYGITAAVYENVNQTTPVFATTSNNNTNTPILANVNRPENGLTFYASNFNGNHTVGQVTPATNFTSQQHLDLGGTICTVMLHESSQTTVATPVIISTSTSNTGDSRNTIVSVSLNPQ